jgi:hypothetical protein
VNVHSFIHPSIDECPRDTKLTSTLVDDDVVVVVVLLLHYVLVNEPNVRWEKRLKSQCMRERWQYWLTYNRHLRAKA